jgi:hypothetical protein
MESPPPRGAVAVVGIGLLISLAAWLLTRNPGNVGEDVPYIEKADLRDSPPAPLGADGETRIVDLVLSTTGPNDEDARLFRLEGSLRARAPSGRRIDSIRCELNLAAGVHIGHSEGRRAAFPRVLANAGDDAIKEGVPVEFETEDGELAGMELRNAFFRYVVGGDPSVEWPSLAEGKQVWLWRFPKPVPATRVNFAVILVAKGGKNVQLSCTPDAGNASANLATTVRLPRPA